MPERAHIASLEALETFRSSLIVYLNSARPALDEVRGEIVRARLWLESDRVPHWEAQIRKQNQRLQDAEAELFKLRLSSLSTGGEVAQAAVRKARQAMMEAEDKLKKTKRWIRQFDQEIGPLARAIDRLRDALSVRMEEAIADLTRTSAVLADYAGLKPAPRAPEGGES